MFLISYHFIKINNTDEASIFSFKSYVCLINHKGQLNKLPSKAFTDSKQHRLPLGPARHLGNCPVYPSLKIVLIILPLLKSYQVRHFTCKLDNYSKTFLVCFMLLFDGAGGHPNLVVLQMLSCTELNKSTSALHHLQSLHPLFSILNSQSKSFHWLLFLYHRCSDTIITNFLQNSSELPNKVLLLHPISTAIIHLENVNNSKKACLTDWYGIGFHSSLHYNQWLRDTLLQY